MYLMWTKLTYSFCLFNVHIKYDQKIFNQSRWFGFRIKWQQWFRLIVLIFFRQWAAIQQRFKYKQWHSPKSRFALCLNVFKRIKSIIFVFTLLLIFFFSSCTCYIVKFTIKLARWFIYVIRWFGLTLFVLLSFYYHSFSWIFIMFFCLNFLQRAPWLYILQSKQWPM